MKKLGLIFDMIGVVILGFTPMAAAWGGAIVSTNQRLYVTGWVFLFTGFLLSLIAEFRNK